MRALFLAHAYPRYAGDPVGSFVGNLAVALRDHDVQVTVSAPSAPGLAPYEVIDGIPIHRFRYAPEKYETLAYTGTMGAQVRDTVSGKIAMASYLAAAYRAAHLRVRTERFDLVHAHWWFPAGLVASLIHRRARVPYLVTMHGSDLRLAGSFPMGESLFRRVAAGAGAVSAVSSWLARDAERLSPQTTVSVAPMPVVDRLFGPGGARQPDRLLFVGKLTEQKGLHRLLRAMTRMRTSAALTVVGAGRVDDAEVKRLASELGLADRIEWLPLLTQEELAVQYRRAAIHVVPALDEGLGLTAVEALLSETPVVGFASGGLPDIVLDGVTGRLVAAGDVEALADALDAVLGDPEARQAMGVAGAEHARRLFGPNAAAARYVALYRDVMATTR
ncbi:MAG TPA: glycosyltransferase family 4 protein [Gemmatimonadaceae bacterium]|nr:glycosyltransferase family 4 protein [Gemmatimonadaceae bacterium]